MSTKHKFHLLPPWRLLLTNYAGGVGYYAWHFAWIMVVFLATVRLLQFWIFGGDPLLYTPAQTVPAGTTTEELGVATHLVLTGISILLCVGVTITVICLPYWIGHVSRGIPRWFVRQTSWPVTRRSLYRVKLAGTASVAACAILLLYYPGASFLMNLGFLVVVGSSLVACTGFLVQHICATLWDIPERRLF